MTNPTSSPTLKEPFIDDYPVEHWRRRPVGVRVDIIVVHSMGERIRWWDSQAGVEREASAEEFLRYSDEWIGNPYSAHRLCRPDGELIRLVNDDVVSYHAGKSAWEDEETLIVRKNLNNSSMGIEVLLPGTWEIETFNRAMREGGIAFTDQQYESVAWQVFQWEEKFDVIGDRVLRHSQVAGDDVRGIGRGKLDPGNSWDMARMHDLVEDWRRDVNRKRLV